MRTYHPSPLSPAFTPGVRHFLNFMNHKNKKALQEKKLEVWEGEGGAVPVAKSRTAAQVKPRKRPAASPRGVN
jgi:hypothetical protein